jgi:hypothetical protein
MRLFWKKRLPCIAAARRGGESGAQSAPQIATDLLVTHGCSQSLGREKLKKGHGFLVIFR